MLFGIIIASPGKLRGRLLDYLLLTDKESNAHDEKIETIQIMAKQCGMLAHKVQLLRSALNPLKLYQPIDKQLKLHQLIYIARTMSNEFVLGEKDSVFLNAYAMYLGLKSKYLKNFVSDLVFGLDIGKTDEEIEKNLQQIYGI